MWRGVLTWVALLLVATVPPLQETHPAESESEHTRLIPPFAFEFVEPAEELAALDSFFHATLLPRAIACGATEDTVLPVLDDSGIAQHLMTLDIVMKECTNQLQETVPESRVEQWFVDHTWRQELDTLRASAETLLAQNEIVLARITGVSGAVDAELLAYLQHKHWRYYGTHHEAVPDLVLKADEQQSPSLIYMAFRNQLHAVAGPTVIGMLLEHYSWSEPACRAGTGIVAQRTRAALEHALGVAWEQAEPGDEDSLSNTLGYLLHDISPAIQYYEERGWREGLLWRLGIVEWLLAQQQVDLERLPDIQEAEQLLMDHRRSPSLVTEHQLQHVIGAFEMGSYHEWIGQQVVALPALKSQFMEPCTVEA